MNSGSMNFTTVLSICLISLHIAAMPTFGREAKLVIWPAKLSQDANEYSLLPKQELRDEDAALLYEQALEKLPKDANIDQIRQWLNLPLEQFPQEQAEKTLQQYMESLRLVARAARCEECNWPEYKPGAQPAIQSRCRNLAFVIGLWARLEISRSEYDGAMAAVQTGFGMARHLGQTPIIVQALIGTAVSALMCRDVEQFVQGENAPNLYWALENLPEPFIDMEKAIESEKRAHLEQVANDALHKQFEQQLEPAHERVRMVAKKLDSNLNALQCIEAIRLYAAKHEGQLPDKLSDIAEVKVPDDPLTGGAFEYRRTAAGAVLTAEPTQGGTEKDAIRYELTMRK
jgi:hypothetical protein